MSSKPGWAMVEMGDHHSCNTIIQNLTGCQVMGNVLKFRYLLLCHSGRGIMDKKLGGRGGGGGVIFIYS